MAKKAPIKHFSDMLIYNPNSLIYISIYIYPTVLHFID